MNFFEVLDSNAFTLVPVEFYFKSFDETFSMPMHSHANFEFMYAESGNFTVSVFENGEQQDYEVFEGGFIFIHTQLPHKLVISKPVKICNLELAQAALPPDCKIQICPILNSFEIFRQMKKKRPERSRPERYGKSAAIYAENSPDPESTPISRSAFLPAAGTPFKPFYRHRKMLLQFKIQR